MEYLRIFETEREYNENLMSLDYPTVSYVEELDTYFYVDEPDYSQHYLTFKALEDGTFTLTIPSTVTSTYMTSVSYSLDYGETWETTSVNSTAQTITTPTVSAGQKVLWKGVGKRMAKSFYNYSRFSSTGNFNVSGNIMSLLYGDEFANQVEFPSGSTYSFCYLFTNNNKLISVENLTLSATTLVDSCYYGMFNGCSKLNYIKAMFTTTPSTSYTNSWVYGVASTGTFIKSPMASWDVTGSNGVPTGWITQIAEIEWTGNYFTTEAVEDSVFTLTIGSGVGTDVINYIEYSTDNGSTWTKTNNVASTTVTVTTPTIAAGNSVKWRGIANGLSLNDNSSDNHSTFSSTGNYNVSGNIMTLVSNSTNMNNYSFAYLFSFSTNLINASNLTLPINLARYCYQSMFRNCTALTTAPELPATTLANYCYRYMFYGCTSLTTAPELPATTLANYCYQEMFRGCSSLNYIKAMFTTTPSTTYTSNWVSGVASTGTFVKNSAAQWDVTGTSGVPTGWTIETAAS